MSVQLLDKTRKINKLLHNNNSHKVVFNDICKVLSEILLSNILVISKKGKVLGVSIWPGVDEIEELIEQISDSGISVLYISSELDELVRECDRIVILHDGRNVGELVNEEINSDAIMNVIASGQIDI